MLEAILYLLAITTAEVLTVTIQPLWGIAGHTVILAALILHASLRAPEYRRAFLLSLALVPLIRIISLAMPLAQIPRIWWYPIIYTPLLAAGIAVTRILGYSAEQTGITLKMFPAQLMTGIAVGLTGIAFGVAEYLILKPAAMISELTLPAIWLPALILLLGTGFIEEFIFRGVLQHSATNALGKWAIVYVSLLFAVLHLGFYSVIDIIFVFSVALFYGWVVRQTGSLLGVALSHGITNIMLFLVIPFLSG